MIFLCPRPQLRIQSRGSSAAALFPPALPPFREPFVSFYVLSQHTISYNFIPFLKIQLLLAAVYD